MAKAVMVIVAFVCAVIGGVIGQSAMSENGFAVGAGVGFVVGFCVAGFIWGRARPEE